MIPRRLLRLTLSSRIHWLLIYLLFLVERSLREKQWLLWLKLVSCIGSFRNCVQHCCLSSTVVSLLSREVFRGNDQKRHQAGDQDDDGKEIGHFPPDTLL